MLREVLEINVIELINIRDQKQQRKVYFVTDFSNEASDIKRIIRKHVICSDPLLEIDKPWFTYRKSKSIASHISTSMLPEKREQRRTNWLLVLTYVEQGFVRLI